MPARPADAEASADSVAVAAQAAGGTFRDRRRPAHRSELPCARCWGAVRGPSPRSVMALAVLFPVQLTFTASPAALPECSDVNRPLLAFACFLCLADELGRHLPHRRPPKGSCVRVHARPLLVRRRAGRSCHPSSSASEEAVLPGEQPLGRCPGPAPEGAGPSPSRGPAGGCPVRCRSPCRSMGCRRLPRHRRLVALRPSVVPGTLPKEAPLAREGVTRSGSCGAGRKRPAAKSLAGLLSWILKDSPLRRHLRCVSTPSALPASTERGAHRGEHAAASRRRLDQSGPLPPSTRLGFGFPSWALRPRSTTAPASLRAFGPRLPHLESRSVPAVSHDFDGLRHACSAGLLHPAADHGVRPVAGNRRGSTAGCASTSLGGPRPLRLLDPQGDRLCHRDRCRHLHRWRSRRPASVELDPAAGSDDPAAGSSPRAHRPTLPRCCHRRRPEPTAPPEGDTPAPWLRRPGCIVFLPRVGRPPKRSTGTGRPTFATATLPPPHEVGSDPPALACLRAVLSGAYTLRSFSLGHSAFGAPNYGAADAATRVEACTGTCCKDRTQVLPSASFRCWHQVTLAAAPSPLPPAALLPATEVAGRARLRASRLRAASGSRPRGLLPCPSPLPPNRLRGRSARCSLGLWNATPVLALR
jgi:hypothetical protein